MRASKAASWLGAVLARGSGLPLWAATGGPTHGLLECPFEHQAVRNQVRFGAVRNTRPTICAAQLLHTAQPVTIDWHQRARSPEYAITHGFLLFKPFLENLFGKASRTNSSAFANRSISIVATEASKFLSRDDAAVFKYPRYVL